jgi:hypothetical protein
VAAATALASLALPASAHAQDPRGQEVAHPSLLDRPHTVAQLEAGIIALPNAPISGASQGGATPIGRVGNGDATLLTGMHLIYRATREWAIGAGVLFAPRPTSDTNYGAGASGLSRAHSRSYLFMGGETRYFPFRTRWLEAWVGLTVGAVIVGDRFVTNNAPPVPPILGTNSVTVNTEGFAVGLQTGADYLITESWVVGLTLRGDNWILPNPTAPTQCDAILDCPTLKGSVAAFEVGLGVGYRIPL